MTTNQKIAEMMNMQAELDRFICAKKSIDYSRSKTTIKLIEEVGELLKTREDIYKTHKTNCNVDHAEELKELVDIWHYVLSLNNYALSTYRKSMKREELIKSNVELARKKHNSSHEDIEYMDDETTYFETILCNVIIENDISNVLQLTYYLNYTVDDIYAAYCSKNQENYSRQNKGY